MGRIIITGGSGLLGDALTDALTASGHEVIILSRNPSKVVRLPKGARAIAWDARSANGWGEAAEGALAIVNLAGATIARPPWTAAYKRTIRESRINAGRAVVEAVRAAQRKPSMVLQQSGIGHYGLHGDEVLTEQAPAGDDFIASVTEDWEHATAEVESLGVRRVVTRTGLVLSAKGGILPLVSLPFRFFVGGPVGSGRQYWSWIHIDDVVDAMCFLIEQEAARGVFNLTAPNPVTNAEFSRALARALHRPALVPAPGFALKLALGELADLLILGGQRVVPQRLQQQGYQFHVDEIGAALRDVYRT